MCCIYVYIYKIRYFRLSVQRYLVWWQINQCSQPYFPSSKLWPMVLHYLNLCNSISNDFFYNFLCPPDGFSFENASANNAMIFFWNSIWNQYHYRLTIIVLFSFFYQKLLRFWILIKLHQWVFAHVSLSDWFSLAL